MAMRFKIRLVQPCVAGGILSLAVALAPRPAFGEGQKTTNTTSTGVITPNSNLPTGFQPTPQFVNGKVALDDGPPPPDRKSTRLNSSHLGISYAGFCLK